MSVEFVVTRRDPVHDPEAFQRAMRILETGFKRAAIEILRDMNHMQEQRPDRPEG